MFQEPQILPWLARKEGVPFAEAREIWRAIASQAEFDRSADTRESAWRQIGELRRQLRERGQGRQAESDTGSFEWSWLFPLPLFQTWAEYQIRIVLDTWLAWARARRGAQRPTSCNPAVGN